MGIPKVSMGIPKVSMGIPKVSMGIPKVTHQIWLQGWSNVPEKFKENIALLHSLNPEYKHMTWDDASLRTECSKIGPHVLAKYDSFKYLIQKVDLGRYVVAYNWGGITVDTDMKSFKALDMTPGLSESDFIISSSAFPANMLGFINNALIMVKKRHPILLEIIEAICASNVKESDFSSKEFYIGATTSPRPMTPFYDIIISHINEITILDSRFFEPCFSVDPVCAPDSKAIMDHKHELSWFSGLVKILAQILIILLYILIFAVVPYYLLKTFIRNYKPVRAFKSLK